MRQIIRQNKKDNIHKMTNLEALLAEDCDSGHDPRLAALLAMHLITQVLDDAYVIANAAKESGQPWRCLSLLKNLKSNRSYSFDENISFKASKGDSVNENKMEMVANIVATSTPQKLAAKRGLCSAEQPLNMMNDLIGQGDEEVETPSYELRKSTSMFINTLFDMSEVEHIIICDDTETNDNTTHNEFLIEATNKIVESHITNIIVPLEEELVEVTEEINEKQEVTAADQVFDSIISESSLVVDAFVKDIGRDVAFFIDEIVSGKLNEAKENLEDIETIENTAPEKETAKNDVNLFESAFLTLNCDYDQCSDEDGFPVLQDPKEMILQEVELLTANTSQDNLSLREPKQNNTEEVATISGVSVSRKSSLARRCRMQGARLLACIRGWWRRKTPGKRKGPRQPGALKGMCPLSPAARRRSSSLLDNRLVRSTSPSHPALWKFNTVNETVVNSNRWKEYTFDTNPEEF